MSIVFKKFIIFIVFFLSFIQLPFAQNIIVTTGLNLSNMLANYDDLTLGENLSMKPGFHVGTTFSFPISDIISFEPCILFETKGFKFKENVLGIKTVLTTNLYYVDIPMSAKVNYSINDDISVFGGFGPYLGLGLIGNIKTKFNVWGYKETEKEKLDWGNNEEEDDLKRFDFGLTFRAGANYKMFQASISYDIGLVNISSYTEDETKAKNRVLRFSIGYLIREN
ncbi:MAG: PorT family protein [Sphingobacteriales bacterium]|nr:MAG: PorT family protein [Sphingobacteriales bacterium]